MSEPNTEQSAPERITLEKSIQMGIDGIARHIARPIRGCATDEQYTDVVQRATDALAARVRADVAGGEAVARGWQYAGVDPSEPRKVVVIFETSEAATKFVDDIEPGKFIDSTPTVAGPTEEAKCVKCGHGLLPETPLDDMGRCVVRMTNPDGDANECGCKCVFSATTPTPAAVAEAALSAAREIVEMIEVEREPHPEWSKNARRKYQDKAAAIIAKLVGPREDAENQHCNFCHKKECEVSALIQAAVGHICNECLKVCAGIIEHNLAANQQSIGECCINCGHNGPLGGGVCYAARDKNDDRIQVHCGCRCVFQSAVEVLHCSCGAACTPEEYKQHVAMGHDAPQSVQSVGERIVDALSRGYLSNAETIAEIDAAILSAVQAEREVNAKVADQWAQSHSCDSHDYDPCCHVRTGVAIATAIRKEKG